MTDAILIIFLVICGLAISQFLQLISIAFSFKRKYAFFLMGIPLHVLALAAIDMKLISPWIILVSMAFYPVFTFLKIKTFQETQFIFNRKTGFLSALTTLIISILFILNKTDLGLALSFSLFLFYMHNIVLSIDLKTRELSSSGKVLLITGLSALTAGVIYSLLYKLNPNSHSKMAFFISLLSFSIIGLLNIFSYLRNYEEALQRTGNQKAELFAKNLVIINANNLLEKRLLSIQNQAFNNQISPHFIFNAINSINSIILTGKPSVAELYINKLSGFLEELLNETNSSFNSLEREIELSKTYLLLEQLRVNKMLDFRITLDEKLSSKDLFLPKLFFQSILENSIWHGLIETEEPEISLEILLRNEAILIRLQDNGIGINATSKKEKLDSGKHKSAGIGILENRLSVLEEHFKVKSHFKIADLSDSNSKINGTLVEIVLPVISKEPKIKLMS